MSVIDFINETESGDIPESILEQAHVRVVDLVAVAMGGWQTEMAEFAAKIAIAHMQPADPKDAAALLFEGSRLSRVGAAFANASMIDSLDAHDGHAGPMGHAGVALLPALLACCHASKTMSGREFLTSLVIGYEIALRAGIARSSRNVSPIGSGAWNAIGCAAIGARCLGLDSIQTQHALGIAEFNAPISPIERSIAHPTMVKDGAGPGAASGVMAALLAREGFTGAPAECVTADEHEDLWSSVGDRWEIMSLNFKPYPIIKWAEPAVQAAMELLRRHDVRAKDIEDFEVFTFKAASNLDIREPDTTERAQYSLVFPVAAALVHGRLDAAAISGAGLSNATVLRLSRSARITHLPEYDVEYPSKQTSHVVVHFRDGSTLTSDPYVMMGAQPPLAMDTALAKLRTLAAGSNLDARRQTDIENALVSLFDSSDISVLSVLFST